MPEREDRRVRRTRQQLREALLALVHEEGFEGLTVQRIIDRADVGRATFYAHFQNKEELLLSGFGPLREQLAQRQREARARAPGQPLAFSRALFEHVDAHREVFRVMVGKRSGAAVLRELQQLLIELMRAEVVPQPPVASRTAIRRGEPVARFLAGGFQGLLAWWLEERPALSVDEIDSLFRTMALPALRAAK